MRFAGYVIWWCGWLGFLFSLTVQPATAQTTSITNGDTAGLIQAIIDANANAGPTTIDLSQNGTYEFTTTHVDVNALPIITSNITINGNNATLARNATGEFRFFEVASNGYLTLNDLYLSQGRTTSGGAIYNDGLLQLDSVEFQNNGSSIGRGGAIYNTSNGNITSFSSSFVGNTAEYGGGIYNVDGVVTLDRGVLFGNTAEEDGGFFYNDGGNDSDGLTNLTLTRYDISANEAVDAGGAIYNEKGGAIYMSEIVGSIDPAYSNEAQRGGMIFNTGMGSNVVLENTSLLFNGGIQGVIWNGEDATLTMTNIQSTQNKARVLKNNGPRATATLTNVEFDNDSAALENGADSVITFTDGLLANLGPGSSPAYIGVSYSTLTMTDVEIRDNVANFGNGGAIVMSLSEATFNNVTFDNNVADYDGGAMWIYLSTVTINNSRLTNNSTGSLDDEPGDGGAIWVRKSTLTINDSTIDNNSATNGGGIAYDDDGTNSPGIVNIYGSTISNNTATERGGGLYATENLATDIVFDVVNSTVSSNTAGISGGASFVNAGGIRYRYATVINNTATNDATLSGIVMRQSTVLRTTNVMIARNGNNGIGNCTPGSSTVYFAGNNYEDGTTCTWFTHQNANLPTTVLRDNGGPTETHAPGRDNDAVDGASGACPEFGQRGYVRPSNGVCDAGAVEAQQPAPVDMDDDGFITPLDAIYIVNRIDGGDMSADLDGDSDVDGNDLLLVLVNLGKELQEP